MAGVVTFKLGDWKLQSGQSIPDAHIAYKTFGDPKSPAIIYPSWYSGGSYRDNLASASSNSS
jgi:homoserine acetyltransferase